MPEELKAAGGPALLDEIEPETPRFRALMLELVRLMNLADRLESACCGVTVGQCLTLATLRAASPLTGQQLADALGLAPSTVTRAIAPLVDEGWVRRRRDPSDRRQVWHSLTKRGDAKAAELDRRAGMLYGEILRRIPEHVRDHTLGALELLLDACRQAQAAQAACPAKSDE